MKILSVLTPIFMATLMAACTPLKQYHPISDGFSLACACYDRLSKVSKQCVKSEIHTNEISYRYGFVEFDEFGNLFQQQALDKLVDEIEGISGNVLIVVYAHGWKHSASDDDGDVKEFKIAMRNIAAMDSDNPRKVVGIYFGWRGGVTPLFGVKELTFWDRKSTAHAVGSGAVAEVVLRLEKIKNEKNKTIATATRSNQSRLVVIGHSFGGAVLYTALAPIMESRLVEDGAYEDSCRIDGKEAQGTGISPRGVGDLIVLINPAFEAMKMSTLHKMSQKCKFQEKQPPILAVVTGDSDWATGIAFPIARGVRASLQSYGASANPEENFWANTKTIGHYDKYLTHKLSYAASDGAVTQNKTWSVCNNYQPPVMQFMENNELQVPPSTIVFPGKDENGRSFSLTLRPQGTYSSHNPILNILATKPIITGHGGIYSCELLTFITALVSTGQQILL